MVKSKKMRMIARVNLKGHWIQAIGVCIFIALASMLIGRVLYEGISLLSGVIIMIIVAPLTFGLDLYMLRISKGEYKFSNLFEMFRSKMIWKIDSYTVNLDDWSYNKFDTYNYYGVCFDK